MLRHLTLTIMVIFITDAVQIPDDEFTGQNNLTIETTTTATSLKLSYSDKMKTTKIANVTNTSTTPSRAIITPPYKLFHEYLRCYQLGLTNRLPTPYSCPYQFEEESCVCWKATRNGTYASNIIKYDHGLYDGVLNSIGNCTLKRFCQADSTWAMTLPPEIQCKNCSGEDRPVKFNSISIMIETMSLSLSLVSLTIAVLCMLNVKRLHLPRNLLHMHLFLAFILRSIVKLVFIHSIIGGYTRSMITYTRDQCGNIGILSKSSSLFHVLGCRMLSSLFWYTDAVSQTFIFCEAMFLFTALTSHLFRDRGCLLFVLWGWLSPLVWLTMWIASHVITDRIERRSTCWLEADYTTYFYYFFYVPYAFYLLVNFGIFLFLVQLLYSKYQSKSSQTNRTGNKHLIKSILILIPLFGLHSIFVIWVFYHKNEGHTIWYYIVVIFKAVFGDLQGFFASLIYFYFNTEIRHEVLRQIQRTLLSKDAGRRSSAGDTLSTRLSVFRLSLGPRRHSSIPNRNERRRVTVQLPTSSPSASVFRKPPRTCWITFLTYICPCLFKNTNKIVQQKSIEPLLRPNNLSPTSLPHATPEDDPGHVISPLLSRNRPSKGTIDTDGLTCDTDIMKHEHDDGDSLSDENDVTFHLTSFTSEHISNHTPSLTRHSPEAHRTVTGVSPMDCSMASQSSV